MTLSTITLEEAAHRRATLRLHTQRIQLDLSQAETSDTYEVSTLLSFASTAPEVDLDYLGESVSSVELAGEPHPFTFSEGKIRVEGIPAGEDTTLKIVGQSRYSRSGQGLHRFRDPSDGNTYLYSHLEPSDARRIYPCFDQPDLKMRFDVEIIAPTGWAALSNQPEIAREEGEHATTHVFNQTPPLSTYLTCFAAGPYAHTPGEWVSPSGQRVELGVWVRQSMAQYLDEEILEVTCQGLSFFDEHFGFPYPWGKYDSIFVPEYNLGAMENPGLVTFTERYVFRSAATRAQHAGRANTILHEMSHMWFGDLVTPQWWDDLWLKESFAEFMGADSSVEATKFSEAWVNFAGNCKNWAYAQDQLPTTHPIKAEIPDVDAARQNFDGITYAKGAAVLKQLVHYVGRDNFYAASRDYFRAHAFGAATFDDLLSQLKNHSDLDLDAWATLWLRTFGPDTLTSEIEVGDGKITALNVLASAEDQLRPHRIDVSLFRRTDAGLERYATLDALLPGEPRTEIPKARGLDAPDLVLLNDNDHTYAKVEFDETSLTTIASSLSELPDEISRAVIWTSLWNLTRDAKLPAARFVDIALRHGAQETNPTLATQIFGNAQVAASHYAPEQQREAIRATLADSLWYLLVDAQESSDSQLLLARAAIHALAATPDLDAAGRLRQILEGRITGLALDPDIRWSVLTALAARDETTQVELDAELHIDDTLSGKVAHLGASHSFPTAEKKETILKEVLTPGKWSNSEVDALLEAWNAPRSSALTTPHAKAYFELLDSIWANHPIEIANRLVRGLYPDVPEALAATDAFLATPKPGALRRVLLECQDTLQRRLRCQEAG